MPDFVTTPAVTHDYSGHVVEQQTASARSACGHVSARAYATSPAPCMSQSIDDPTTFGPIVIALASGVLIICGALTFFGRGPGKLIRTKSRRRGAGQRVQRWRRRIGVAMVVLGVGGLVRAFL